MGDVVLSTSVIAPLAHSGYQVKFVCKTAFAPLLENHPLVAEVRSFDPVTLGGERAAKQKFLQWAEAEGFAFALDLQNSWRTRWWTLGLRSCAAVHALPKERWREFAIRFLRLGRWLSYGRGGRARKFREFALEKLPEGDEGAPLTSLFLSAAEKSSVLSLVPKQDYAVLLPASAWKGKEWPYFPELAALLAKKIPVVVLGGAKDESCDRVAAAAQAVNAESRSLRGHTTLRESMAVVAGARWIVGNDTGLVHVGEAFGKSVAMVEGPTHEYMGFSPYRPDSLLLGLPLFCRPCSKSGKICPRFGSRKCLYDLKVDEVAALLRQGGFPC